MRAGFVFVPPRLRAPRIASPIIVAPVVCAAAKKAAKPSPGEVLRQRDVIVAGQPANDRVEVNPVLPLPREEREVERVEGGAARGEYPVS